MRTMTFCLAAILLALFDSGPVQAAPGKALYTMTSTQPEHKARDGVLMTETARESTGFFCITYAPREAPVLVVASPPPVPRCAPVVYIYAEPSCGLHATNSYILRERPYLAPIVYRTPTCYRRTLTLSYR